MRLDFDPSADVEEIRSTLLNRDFALDANGEQTLYPTNEGAFPSFLSPLGLTSCLSTHRDKRAKTWAGATAAGS